MELKKKSGNEEVEGVNVVHRANKKENYYFLFFWKTKKIKNKIRKNKKK